MRNYAANVTPDMIEAGRIIVQRFDADFHDKTPLVNLSTFLSLVYEAMGKASNHCGAQPSNEEMPMDQSSD